MTADVRLERDGQVALAFRGELLAAASSADTGKMRWTEMRLWSTESGRWVLERLGCSAVPGEVTKRSAVVCLSPEAIVQSLWKSANGQSYLPHIALDLLEDAAEADPRLRAVTVETL